MKKLSILLAGMLLAAALCIPAMAEEDDTIMVNLKTLSSEYWQSVKSGIDKAAEDYGLTVTVEGPEAETQTEEQIRQIEAMLAENPDAVIIAPLDADAVSEAIRQSGYQGKVIFCDTDCDYEGKTSFVGISNEDAAYEGGTYGVGINKDGTRALILYGQEEDRTSSLRRKGYEEALEKQGLKPVEELSGNNTTEDSREVTGRVLKQHPDGINLILCHNDDTAIGAMNAVQEAGMEGVSIIGFDGNSSAMELIYSGDLTATVAQQPALIGYMSVETALKALKGEEVEEKVEINTVIVDAGNCMDYLPE